MRAVRVRRQGRDDGPAIVGIAGRRYRHARVPDPCQREDGEVERERPATGLVRNPAEGFHTYWRGGLHGDPLTGGIGEFGRLLKYYNIPWRGKLGSRPQRTHPAR